MFFKYLIILLFIFSCTTNDFQSKKKKLVNIDHTYSNIGFTLIYDDDLKKKKILSKKMNVRKLEIFQRNLKKNKIVKVTNLINNKSIIAVVGSNSVYPHFYNSVISKRIAEELEINYNEPYIQILEIDKTNTFIAKKSKMFDEEKNVADKAPVMEITIKSISSNQSDLKAKNIEKPFNYIIKIADFYYKDSAKTLVNRLNKEIDYKNGKIKKLSKTKYRVFVGPFFDLNTLKDAFNDILKLNFENIEIIKLWKKKLVF